MIFSMPVQLRAFTIAMILSCAFLMTVARAERVGYRFDGHLIPPSLLNDDNPLPDNYKIFNVVVPTDAPITGTFSYDTTALGNDVGNNSKAFAQGIQGGLTFDVLGPGNIPLLHVVASQSTVTATNDYLPKDTPSPIDALEVDLIPPPAPFLANNASITRKSSVIAVPFNWDEDTFTGPDQPYLWSNLPEISYASIGTIGSIPTQTSPNSLASFLLTSLEKIQPPSGDYNFDSVDNANDYAEWRNAFGDSDAPHAYADGNQNGVVDGADYVLWRHSLSLGNANATSIPEPSLVLLALVALGGMAGFHRWRS